MAAQSDTGSGGLLHANGIDIHYVDAGEREPLVLLDNGMISTNPIWADWLSSYLGTSRRSPSTSASSCPTSAVRPDRPPRRAGLLRPAGRRHRRPDRRSRSRSAARRGYGDGGTSRPSSESASPTGAGGREPWRLRPVQPRPADTRPGDDPADARRRPDAAHADPDAHGKQRAHLPAGDGRAHEGRPRRRTGPWPLEEGPQQVLRPVQPALRLHRRRPPHDHRAHADLVGDRDPFCSVEEGASAYRALPDGELAVLPNTAVGISPPPCRQRSSSSSARLETEPLG